MKDEFLDTQNDVIALLGDHGYDVEAASLEEYNLDEPATGTLTVKISLSAEGDGDGRNPYRVK